jgi:hypothetical protein
MLIQPRRGTADQWTSANPILAVGEMGYETDTKKFKYGDGLTAWVTLPYGISAANLSNATATGLAVLTASNAAAARTALGVGTGTSVQAADILDSTATGRALLLAASTTAAQTALGATAIGRSVLTSADAAAARTAVGAGTYTKPGTGIPATDLASAVQTSLGKADTALQAVASNLISDASAIGRSILTAADAAAVRSAIGAGTSNVAIGTTAGTALSGTYVPTSTSISDSTTVGRGLLTAASADSARAVIGAGTSNLALGTTASTALAGNYAPTSTSITDATAVGRGLLTAVDAAAARTLIGAGTGTGTGTISSTSISDSTAVGRSLLTAASAAAALAAIGAGTGTYTKPGTGIPSTDLATAVQTSLGRANTALQTVNAASLTDSTTVGRAVIVAADAAAARTAIGAGTYSKPGTNIPAADLATAVQTSLGKADTAIQAVSSTTISDATTVGRSLITAANAAAALTAIGGGTYSKPGTGIPSTDFTSAVQTSLGLANTALQTVSSTTLSDATAIGRSLLTAASTSAALTAIGAGSYSRPGTGIPLTDLATSVQTSLGLANTALQTAPTISSTTITDATTVGKALITAVDAASARTAIGAGTGSGTYSKPGSGIPSTDFTTAVQTSLGKADTSYTKPGTGIPSSDLASAVQTSLTLANAAYAKPGTGIPATDLATAVQTNLTKASTALQSVPTGYVAGSSNGTATNLTVWIGTAAQYTAIASKSATTVYVVT